MSGKNKNTDDPEEEDEKNVTSKGSSTNNNNTDSSQSLDLPPEFCEDPEGNPERMLKEAKSKIRNAPKSYAEASIWFGRVRKFGLWRSAKRNKYKSFADFYRDMGYTADQVCHLIAISKVLTALIDKFGKCDAKVTVYHGTVLLSGTRDKDVRFETDTKLACDIFRTVLDKHGKVTGKLLRQEMVDRDLVNAPKSGDAKLNRNNSDLDSDDDQIGEAVDGMSLGEDADEATGGQGEAEAEDSNAASGENHAAAAAQAAAVAQTVRRELVQARTIASDLLDEVEKSHAHQKLRPRLIELRSLLDEIEKQLGS